MSNNTEIILLLVGAGNMAVEYSRVLKALEIDFAVVSRGIEKATLFEEKTGICPFTGGLKNYLAENNNSIPTHAILAVGVESLAENCLLLLNTGIKNILVEKPGGKSAEEIEQIACVASQTKAKVFLGYNRRFYSSVIKAREIIREDGDVCSFHFEFTEWGEHIATLPKRKDIKQVWFIANSTHVVDMAFFLGGKPLEMDSFTAGGNEWHPSATIFSGAGITESGALFSYHANWDSPGRWGLEVLTSKHRLIFRPLEELSIQERGKLEVDKVQIEDKQDKKYKPGLYMQVRNWLSGNEENLCSIDKQSGMMKWYCQMANYPGHL